MTRTKMQKGKKKKEIALTLQQKDFVKHLIADPKFDCQAAAKQAGYANPKQAGSRLLTLAPISVEVANAIKRRADRLEFTADEILLRLKTLLEVDITYIYDDAGFTTMDKIKDLPPMIRQCITKIKAFRKWDIDEDGNKNYYNELEVEWMSKDAAMQLAMKHFGLLQPEINVMVVSDEMKNRILIELLQQTAPTPDKISIVDGTVIDRLVNEL